MAPLLPFFLMGSTDTTWVLDTRTETAYRTTDGGTVWQKGQPPRLDVVNDGSSELDFVDADHGWLLVSSGGSGQDGELLQTSDGGMSWTEAASTRRATLPSGGGISFSPTVAGLGWLRPEPELGPMPLYVTHDGGRTWAPAALPLPAGYSVPPSPGHSYPYAGLPTFPGGAAGGVLPVTLFGIGAAPNKTSFLTTTDGGATWVASPPLDIGSSIAAQTFWLNAKIGWIYVSGQNAFSRTDDGGKTWTAVHSTEPLSIVSFAFAPDGRAGWAVLSNGGLVFTKDGGTNAAPAPPPISSPPWSVWP